MLRKYTMLVGLVLLLPGILIAQDGKLRGVVTDSQNGEPLIGANVFIEETTLGAATDERGEYIMLSIPPGTYTVRVSFIGYAPVILSNLRINANLTTTQDFQLTSSAIQVGSIEVVSERPLIHRNTTNTVRFVTQEDIGYLPFRGLQNIVALEAGVVQQNGNLHVRGGRAGEVAYFIDGANTTNPFFNSQNVSVIQEAIEELQLQAGGYTAELGGAGSAIIRTTVRTGGNQLHGSIDYQSDRLAAPGDEFLSTGSFGYQNVVGTIGGPITSRLRFFLAGQHNYLSNRDMMFIEPFYFDNLTLERATGDLQAGEPLPWPLDFRQNHLPGNWQRSNSGQGTLLYDLNTIKLRFTGTYSSVKQPIGSSWPGALQGYYNQQRNRLSTTESYFGNIRATHLISEKMFYEIGIAYQSRSNWIVDPDFGHDWQLYADRQVNEEIGYTGFTGRYRGPLPYRVIDGFEFRHENAPNTRYDKDDQISIGGHLDITTQVERNWEVKAGGSVDMWTVSNYSILNIPGAMEFLYGEDGNNPAEFESEQERRVRLAKAGVINHYGYDVDGKKVSSGLDAPREPFFASAYIQNKMEFADLVLNVGLRMEHFDTKNKVFRNPEAPDFDSSLDIVDESALKDQDPVTHVMPRISFSFPVTDETIFYAMYGRYVQMPSLNQAYVGTVRMSRTVSPITRGNAFLTPVGYFVKPERTTQYEMGIRQMLTDNFAFTLSGFYKDLNDQLAVRRFTTSAGQPLYTAYMSEDFGTVKGIEFTLELRRTNRLSAKMNYTLSDARGTGSDSQSSFGVVEQPTIGRFPNFISPLDFDQTHRGTLMLDYRFPRGDGGPILEGFGINLLFTFNSGHGYTHIFEPSELGQANPWNVGVRPLIDPRSRKPAEPLNQSTTPWVFNLDLNLNKMFYIGNISTEVYLFVQNVFDTKHVINVFPSTGTPNDDGWLRSPLAAPFVNTPNYVEFYQAINLDNRWAYMGATGNDTLGEPRRVRLGIKIEI
jgi:hypothetical protein